MNDIVQTLISRVVTDVGPTNDPAWLVSQLSGPDRLVFKLNFIQFGCWYSGPEYEWMCSRLHIESPDEIPVYIFNPHFQNSEFVSKVIRKRNAMRKYFLSALSGGGPMPNPPYTAILDDFVGLKSKKLLRAVRLAIGRNRLLENTVLKLAKSARNDVMRQYLLRLTDS